MFRPTHWLVSRTQKVPVVVRSTGEKSQVFMENEWNSTTTPAFELHSRMGLYCQGVQVLGYALEPMVDSTSPQSAMNEPSKDVRETKSVLPH
jgi:hypothetical protein